MESNSALIRVLSCRTRREAARSRCARRWARVCRFMRSSAWRVYSARDSCRAEAHSPATVSNRSESFREIAGMTTQCISSIDIWIRYPPMEPPIRSWPAESSPRSSAQHAGASAVWRQPGRTARSTLRTHPPKFRTGAHARSACHVSARRTASPGTVCCTSRASMFRGYALRVIGRSAGEPKTHSRVSGFDQTVADAEGGYPVSSRTISTRLRIRSLSKSFRSKLSR